VSVPARINLITLGVRDVARSTAFYEALGWRRSSASSDDTSFFLTTGSVLALWRFDLLAADSHLPVPDAPATGGVSLAINLESEAEVDRVLSEAEAAGGEITKAGEKAFWGGYTGNFVDPDGHLWEVAHNPFFPFAADGTLDLPE